MKIHTNTLTAAQLAQAAAYASRVGFGTVYAEITERGSRTHARAFDVILTGDGTVTRRRVNFGTADRDRFDRPFSVHHDAWGAFLSHVFDVDSTAMVPGVYTDAVDFDTKTLGHFTMGAECELIDGDTYGVSDTLTGGAITSTPLPCPECRQPIVVTTNAADESVAIECGGAGEGGCEAQCEKTTASRDTIMASVNTAAVEFATDLAAWTAGRK